MISTPHTKWNGDDITERKEIFSVFKFEGTKTKTKYRNLS